MFHLYFGMFDIILYLGGIYSALLVANAMCDQLDAAENSQKAVTGTSAKAALQPAASRPTVPVAKREEVRVGVGLR